MALCSTLVGCSEVPKMDNKTDIKTNVNTGTVKKGDGWKFSYDENGKRTDLEVDDREFKIYLRDNVNRLVDIEESFKKLNLKNIEMDYMYSYEGYKFITVEFGEEYVIDENMSILVYLENMFINNYSVTYMVGKSSRTEYMGKYVYNMYVKQQDKVYKINGSKLTTVYEKEIFNSFLEEMPLAEYEQLLGDSASMFEGMSFFQ